MEQWRPVVGYEGMYEVSDLGRVRSVERVVPRGDGTYRIAERILKQGVTGRNLDRLVVNLYSDKPVKHYVHHLVLEAFVGPRPPGMESCHWDDDPSNNRLENLRWDTMSANRHDRVRNGRDHNVNKTYCSNGHEFTLENTKLRPDGGRWCRACGRKATREYMRRQRAAAQ